MTPKFRQAMEHSGGRRFLLTVGAGLSTTLLQWFGKLDPAGTTYAMTIGATVAAYITGNTTQKVKAPDTPSQGEK